MYTKNDIIKSIKKIGIKPDDTLLIHSSMKAIGAVENGGDTVLDAFIEYMSDGLLIFPTHTWNNISKNGDIYDPETEPSCVGILSNLFMKREGVVRSLHPTHSVAVLGKNSRDYIAKDNNVSSPAPWDGCWGELYRLNAKILFLGCSLNRNTFIHSVEEWCNIPNRLSGDYMNLKIKTEGQLIDSNVKTHSAPINDISENYGKLLKPMLENNITNRGHIGDAESYLCKAKEMADLTRVLLENDPDYFLK